MSLQNKSVLITGGTGGLGQDVTRAFVEAGCRVFVSYVREKELARLKDHLGDLSGVHPVTADLGSESSVDALFGTIQKQSGRLDVLVHLVGGFWMGGDISETPLEPFEQMLHLNLRTTFLCCRRAFSLMKENGGGKIFTVSARAALELPAGMGAYVTSKAAVLAFSEILAKEGVPHNIQVNTLLPSVIDTPANRRAMPDADFERWVKPREIADVLLALAQPNITAVSGTAVKVYGRA